MSIELKPIKTKKIYEEIVDQIKQHLKEGTLKPGDKLPSEKNLIQTFKVSRASIREALSALESMGILEVRSGEGTYISEIRINSVHNAIISNLLIGQSNIKELLEIRKILELHAVEHAVLVSDEEKLAEIEKSLMYADENISLMQADYQFHYSIVLLTQNSLIIKLMDVISEQIIGIINDLNIGNERIKSICNIEEHVEIIRAIKQKDTKIAQNIMIKHIDNLEDELMILFSKSAS